MASIHVLDPERNRDKEAVEVHKEFAEAYDRIIQETGRMSGFLIIAFDDEGCPTHSLHLGTNFPIPSPMIPEIAKQCVIQQVYSP